MTVLAPGNLATPGLSVPGSVSPFTTATQRTLRVTGPAGAAVKLGKFPAALYLEGVPGGGYDIDPYEVNKVTNFDYQDASIGAGGFVDIPVTMSYSSSTGGIHLFSAILVNGSGNRSSSSDILLINYNPNSGSTDTVAPTTPGSLAVGGVTTSSVTLGWNASTDATGVAGYRIYRNTVLVATTALTGYTDSGRVPSTTYSYGVEAFDAAGNVSPRALISATTAADTVAPSAPGNLQALPGSGMVMLSWTASTDASGVSGYRIRRGGIEIASVNATSYTDTGLGNGITYQYQIIAFDPANNESSASTAAATPVASVQPALRVNAGATLPYVDPLGNTWAADSGFNTGSGVTYSTTILGTSNPQIYQSRRRIGSGDPSLSYQFDLANGNYQVTLHFVEVVSSLFSLGSRVFDITAEGALKGEFFFPLEC